MKIITLPTLLCRFQGIALGRVILIKKGHEGLIQHELIHIQQQVKVGFFTYMWRWWTSERFRATAEIEAYRLADKLDDRAIIDRLVDLYGIAPGMAYRYVLEVR